MRTWPRGAYILPIVLFVIFGFGIGIIFTETRASYRAVGFNDGQIEQREQMMKKIERLGAVEECKKYRPEAKPMEFLSVKADSIFIIANERGEIRFCR
ncbi:hypothetical protein [Rugamonas sp. DEMB1]|jgi:hypothetical protein|uniref:hypothetical protein n=1 Tax=Rugamonas sp. DEMB1 TaxID=3039386 RepID=UPI0024489D63|nr:hypothetical protein [Rugamonas sp. DEMB1]WGG49030.1 hypothetical protein QC826_20695 [Rugamonas sp. DEMB1]